MNEFFLGYPKEFKKICLIYPPKVKEVISEREYATYSQILTFSQEEIEDMFIKDNKDLNKILTPLEFILNNSFNNQQFEAFARRAFQFFIHEPVIFLYDKKTILIGDVKTAQSVNELRLLEEKDFFEFQNLIRNCIGQKSIEPPIENENLKIKKMKAKARYRDKIKAEKNSGPTLETVLVSVCCMNTGLNPLNIGDITYSALLSILSTYQEKEKYETDIDSLLAGADPKKVRPTYWIRKFEDDND